METLAELVYQTRNPFNSSVNQFIEVLISIRDKNFSSLLLPLKGIVQPFRVLLSRFLKLTLLTNQFHLI